MKGLAMGMQRWFHGLSHFSRLIFRRAELDQDLNDEIEYHIEAKTEENIAKGMTPKEALRAARLELGGVEQVKEKVRSVRAGAWLETVLQDIRFGLRMLRRNPALTVIAVPTMALGIGATAVVFTAIKAVLIEPLPYAHPERLVQIRTEFVNARQALVDWATWNDAQQIIKRTRTLESVGIFANAVFDLPGDARTPPEALYGSLVSASLFPTLGVRPMLGRNISAEEDQPGAPNEMILSYGLWKRRFNGDPGVVGHSINVDGHGCLIIGVMPPGFNFPLQRAAARTPTPYVEFWAPMRVTHPHPGDAALGVIGRLRKNVTLAEAQQDIARIGAELNRDFPATSGDRTLLLGSFWERNFGRAEHALWLLMAAALMFLLIGCANVANLLLARGLARRREIAIRLAIGAGRLRLIRQFLTESCILALLGGAGGYLVAVAAWKGLPALAPTNVPRLADARPDWAILLFALGMALVTVLVIGIGPALRSSSATGIAINDFGLPSATPGGGTLVRGMLVMAQVAIMVVLVAIGAQLLGRFTELLGTDPGFNADRLLASIIVPAKRYATPKERGQLYRRILGAVRALPGVESAGTVSALPFSGENDGGRVTANETAVFEPRNQATAEIDIVSSEYLQTMGVRLLAGRWFDAQDMAQTSDSAIVNEVVAYLLWPGASAIGKLICVYCSPENPRNWKRVIGVVSGGRHATLAGPLQPNVFLSASALENAYFLVVRTDGPPDNLQGPIREAIAAIDPNQPILLSVGMRTLIDASLADREFVMSLLVATGYLALVMAIAGVYGVMSYTISRRTREIGVRMALGASPANVRALVFRQGFFSVVVGLGAGLLLTAAVMRILRSVLVGLDTTEPEYVCTALVLVSLMSAVACLIPARKAMRVDPMVALRYE
jgi:predicted permease